MKSESGANSFWVIERFENDKSAGYWDGANSRSFITEIDKAVHFCRKEDAFWATRGWHWNDIQITEHVYLGQPVLAKPSVVARESQHTPLPWRVFDFADVSEGRHEGVWVGADTPKDHPYFGHTKHIQILSDEDYPAKRVDAEFIVRACNAHTSLVEALQAIVEITKLPILHPRLKKTTYNELIWREAEQALRDAGVL